MIIHRLTVHMLNDATDPTLVLSRHDDDPSETSLSSPAPHPADETLMVAAANLLTVDSGLGDETTSEIRIEKVNRVPASVYGRTLVPAIMAHISRIARAGVY